MASERQIAANQANALKSTGPKTAQGKAAARRNALKHGMTCKRESLFDRDDSLYKERLESWTKSAKPRNDMELYQIESAVRATVNLDRCARNERAEVRRRERNAEAHWDGDQTKKLDRAVEFWATEPADCVANLESFTQGCTWMLERWEELSEALEANACWTVSQACFAMRLLGQAPELYFDDDTEGNALRVLVVAASPDLDPAVVDAFLGLDSANLEPEERVALLGSKLPSREDALENLWARIDAELERLDAIRAEVWECEDAPALAEKIDLASFDGSKKGVLRRRYQSANHLDMHRCLKEFSEQRKQTKLRVEEEQEIAEKAKAERLAEIHKQTSKLFAKHPLRNEAKSADTKDSRTSTSGKSESVGPRGNMDPAAWVQKILGRKDPAPAGAPPSNAVAPAAEEAQKPS